LGIWRILSFFFWTCLMKIDEVSDKDEKQEREENEE
jgi:hypothetical protein